MGALGLYIPLTVYMRISELGVPLPVYSSMLDIRRGMWIYDRYSLMDTSG